MDLQYRFLNLWEYEDDNTDRVYFPLLSLLFTQRVNTFEFQFLLLAVGFEIRIIKL